MLIYLKLLCRQVFLGISVTFYMCMKLILLSYDNIKNVITLNMSYILLVLSWQFLASKASVLSEVRIYLVIIKSHSIESFKRLSII